MPNPLAPAPASGTVLDAEDLRAAVADAIHASRRTLAEVAELVGQLPDRDRAPSVSSVSGAQRQTGSSVLALQRDVLRVLTGATLSGPLYRVD